MNKSDSQIQRDVIDELRWDPQTSKTELGVAVKDGVVTLSGTVNSFSQKLSAERAAQRVSGVRALAEDLVVKLDGVAGRSDTEIAHAALSAMEWDTRVPDKRIKVKVENGLITLSGNVLWKFESAAAERCVRYLTGVKGVFNLIHVLSPVSSTEVKSRIEAALKRSVELEARQLSVEALGGKVTLRGNVHSWSELRAAEDAAWSAPGVTKVDDMLTIGA